MSWYHLWRSRTRKLRQRSWLRKMSKAQLIKYISIGCFAGVIFLFLFTTFLFAWYAKDLPQPDKVVRKEGFSTKIYDRNEVLLYDVFANQERTLITIDQVPDYLKKAIIAIEDKNFYKHQGFDPQGWLRQVYNILIKHRLEGGSTITQQLVKNVLLTSQRSIGRKIKEFALAIQIEKKYSKDQILQMYLNEAPYGGTAWGVETASETYFGKKVSDLTLVESAILAGLPQQPTYYSPFGDNPKAYVNRTKDVLRRMREEGHITSIQETEAVKSLETVKFAQQTGKFKAPHFVMYVKKLIEDKYGQKLVEQGGLKIHTTLDWELQQKAQEYVASEIKKVESLHITNGAALVLDTETGEILAMVGSKDYFDPNYDGQVNVCLSQRQPGSSIKPVTYVTAFKKGMTPATMLVDTITHFPGGAGNPDYIPKNYDGKEHGPVQLRYALGNSFNIPSVKLLAKVGVEDMLKTAYDLGFSTLEPTKENVNRFGLSVTLGGGEVRLIDMVSAYAAFSNGGTRVTPIAVTKVLDQNGKILEENKFIKGPRVLTPEQSFLINDILSDNGARAITFGPNSMLNISSRKIAVKTGTTNDMRDNWTIGWDPKHIVGVWVGNNDNSPMKQVASGVSGASPIWRDIILETLKKAAVRDFAPPSNIVTEDVDQVSGYPSHDGWPGRKEFFIKGTEPTGSDPIHAKLKICKSDNGKLAPDTVVAKGDYDEKEFFVLKEDDPLATDKNRWQEGIDAWISQQGDSRYHFPRDYCQSGDNVVVRFRNLSDKQKIDNNEFEVEAEAVSDKGIDRVEFYADGDLKATTTSKPYKAKIVLNDGIHALKLKAVDRENHEGTTEIKIGVKVDPNASPSPSPSPSLTPPPSPLASPSPSSSPH